MVTIISKGGTPEDTCHKIENCFNEIRKITGKTYPANENIQQNLKATSLKQIGKKFNATKFCGVLRFEEDVVVLQRRWWDEW